MDDNFALEGSRISEIDNSLEGNRTSEIDNFALEGNGLMR